MINLRKALAAAAVFGMIASAGAVYAVANSGAEADISKDNTAKAAAGLNELKAQRLEQRKIILDQCVKEGSITAEQAEAMYKMMQANQAVCDGTDNMGLGRQTCGGSAQCNGQGNGQGIGQCNGLRNGNSNGAGMRFGRGMQ